MSRVTAVIKVYNDHSVKLMGAFALDQFEEARSYGEKLGATIERGADYSYQPVVTDIEGNKMRATRRIYEIWLPPEQEEKIEAYMNAKKEEAKKEREQ